MEVVLNEIVLYAADVEESRAFYDALGFGCVRLEHPTGRYVSYEAMLGSGPTMMIIQIFPAGDLDTTRTRFRLEVPDIDALAVRLDQFGVEYERDGRFPILRTRDPDGTQIYAVGRSRRVASATPVAHGLT